LRRFDNTDNDNGDAAGLTTNLSRTSLDTSTFIIKGRKRALKEAYNRSIYVNRSHYCITGEELLKSYKPLIPLLQDQIFSRGGSSYILTDIGKDTVSAIKDLTAAGAEIKHIDISSLMRSIIYDDTVAYFSIMTQRATENVEQTEEEDLWVGSTELSVVQSAKKAFLADWKNAIPATDRIREIEEGIEPEYFKVFTDRDRERVSQILYNLAESVKNEALILLPSVKSMIRVDRLGVIDHIINASQRGATVKIICPLSEENSKVIKKIDEQASAVKVLNGNNSPYGMYIMDGEKFLRAEVKKAQAETFSEAIGFCVYSNSKLSVDSFRSIFELLWNERTLNEELKRADKMQQEFINIASHEMKTPTQAILGYSKLIDQHPEKREAMIEAIARNATRLQRLTNDILDVTRIETQSLKLDRERTNLIELISDIIEDCRNEIEKTNKDIKLIHEAKDQIIEVEADKNRLTQVISNLLSNAIKFTKEGTIRVTEEVKDSMALVSVKDTGQGIDPEIFPRLYSKFAAKSETGTGLGLFISKSIVEAHGGKIRAENNDAFDRKKGATFTFSIPLSELEQYRNQT
jgi:signal transduction histidine kinase